MPREPRAKALRAPQSAGQSNAVDTEPTTTMHGKLAEWKLEKVNCMGSPRPAHGLPSACPFLCDPPTASDDAIWRSFLSHRLPQATTVSARVPSGILLVMSRTGSQQRIGGIGGIGLIGVGDGSEKSPDRQAATEFPRLRYSC